ncbi:recombinase family protein [Micromonospora sp. DT47]
MGKATEAAHAEPPPVLDVHEGDLLAAWIDRKTPRTRRRGPAAPVGPRFAFYGRVSTRDYQDPVSSRRWQLDVATELIAGRGRIVVEFFDVGRTRELSWAQRPQAAALLAALAGPDRGFDAVVVGEYARAFSGSQLSRLAETLRHHGVEMWIPETDGPVDFDDVTHKALMMMLGAQARREVQRARFRTTMAMQAQAREQGRYLGGRPPYGYRLVDAGPHPNRAHAQWGRRLHRLEPDPDTAPHVAWIFAQRLAGRSIAGIARALNEMGVPCPSAADPVRNPHRPGDAWRLRTVAAILANPRYTGRQVWNRKRSDRERTQDDLPGLLQARRLAARTQWALSTKPAHPALVSEQDFLAAQAVSALPQAADGTKRTYLLAGLLRCALCGRSLESQ